jgi:hypothetical protein
MAHTRAPAGGKRDPSSAYAWTFKDPGCMRTQRASASELGIGDRSPIHPGDSRERTFVPLTALVPTR